jgi:carbamoyltransferase
MEILPRHADIAAALQEATNAAVMALVRRLKRKVPLDNLCFAGGVALNCVTNNLVRQSGDFSDVFIPSAPHDAGTAVGAAFVVHCAKQKSRPPERGNSTPFLGPAFTRREILAAVKSAGLTPRRSKSPARSRRLWRHPEGRQTRMVERVEQWKFSCRYRAQKVFWC